MIRIARSAGVVTSAAARRSCSSSAAAPSVLLDVDDGFATITLNRPKVHNAFSDVVIGEIAEAVRQAGSTPGLRAVFLRAAGKSFSAGGDLEWMRRAATYTTERNKADSLALARMLRDLAELPVPSIAVVQGAAFGGGVGLISACDVAVGVSSAKFMLSEVKLGLLPATISPYVIRRIGANQCRRYFLTAEPFGADRAKEIGLLHEVAEGPEELEAMCTQLRESIRLNSPTGVAASKELIDAVEGRPVTEELMEATAVFLAEQRDSPEGREGIGAFFEKRKPAWAALSSNE